MCLDCALDCKTALLQGYQSVLVACLYLKTKSVFKAAWTSLCECESPTAFLLECSRVLLEKDGVVVSPSLMIGSCTFLLQALAAQAVE